MVPPAIEPSGTDMTDDGGRFSIGPSPSQLSKSSRGRQLRGLIQQRQPFTDNDSYFGTSASQLSASQQSTKSSRGRKLRQVLQKKQLDVLLQTYSTFIDEPEDPRPAEAPDRDFYSISRKKSIEGNPITQIAEIVETRKSSDGVSLGKERANTASPDIRRMRRNKSLISDDGDHVSTAGGRIQVAPPISDQEDSDDAVMETRRSKGNLKEGRKGKKKHVIKRKKKGDLKMRMTKANEIVKGFSTRCGQKHLEIAEDFQVASKELRHHLKSGANIVFEDLADHFDGMVENFFVDGEERDDAGGRQHRRQQQGGASSPTSERQPSSLRNDPSFQPLSHDETLQLMHKQVSELLEPVAHLTDRVHDMSCMGATTGGFEIESLHALPALPASEKF